MSPILLLMPEIGLLLGAGLMLFAELLPGGRRRAAWWGALLALGATGVVPRAATELFGGMLAYDTTTFLARSAIAGLTALFLLWLGARGMAGERSDTAAALVMLSALGGMLLVAANDLVALYMSLELSTMPAYVLIGYARKDERSLEGALKYFLLSLLTSLVMVYGLSFVYGFSGTTSYGAIDLSRAGNLGVFVGVFLLVGFLAKMSAAPFHYWTPDAYEGASAHSVAFVSTVPKVAGLVAMVNLLGTVVGQVKGLDVTLIGAAVLSMLLGNLGAFPQTDLRRLMAYSGIAHTGYLLLGLAAGTTLGAKAAILYAVAYAIPSMGVMLVAAEHGSGLAQLKGLAKRSPLAAWSLVVFFLSLVGIPPTVGFFGKLWLFGSALQADMVWLVVLALVMSVVSLGYYFRVIREAFFGEGEDEVQRRDGSWVGAAALVLAVALTLGAGVFASPVLDYLGFAF